MKKTIRKNEEMPLKRQLAPEESVSIGEGPTAGEIRMRAYEIYEARGSGSGNAVEDWLQAERELYDRYRALQTGQEVYAPVL